MQGRRSCCECGNGSNLLTLKNTLFCANLPGCKHLWVGIIVVSFFPFILHCSPLKNLNGCTKIKTIPYYFLFRLVWLKIVYKQNTVIPAHTLQVRSQRKLTIRSRWQLRLTGTNGFFLRRDVHDESKENKTFPAWVPDVHYVVGL